MKHSIRRSRLLVATGVALTAAIVMVGVAVATDDAPSGGEAGLSEAAAELNDSGQCSVDPYVPTAEELELVNADALGLADLFTAVGIEHSVVTDDAGFASVEYDYLSGVAEAVANSYYEALYPPEPLAQDQTSSGEQGTGVDPAIADSIRQENDALAAVLDEAGLDYTRSTDDGYGWIEWDYDDRAVSDAIDDFYTLMNPPEPVSPEEAAVLKIEIDAFAAAFDAAAIEYQRVTDAWGYETVEWDEDDPTADRVAQDFYLERYGNGDCLGDFDDWTPTEAEIDMSIVEADGLAAAFDAAAIAYTTVTDANGFRSLDWDEGDKAAEAAATEYWDGWDAAFSARVGADLDRLMAALDGEGISYWRACSGECDMVVFDIGDPAALAVVAGVS